MITRLERAQKRASRFLVTLVIVAAVSKDHLLGIIEAGGSELSGHQTSGEPKGDGPTAASAAHGVVVRVTKPPSAGDQKLPTPHAAVSQTINRIRALFVVALICFYALLEYMVEMSVAKLRFVRRFVMGGTDIEDYWLDVVFQSDKVIGGGLIHIQYRAGEYLLEGRDFDANQQWTGWFATEISQYEDKCLLYKYRALRPGEREEGTGHGEYNFNNGVERLPTHYFGHFYEDRNNRRYYVYGERLSVFLPDKKKRRELTQPARVAELVAEFIKQRSPILPVGKESMPPQGRPFSTTPSA